MISMDFVFGGKAIFTISNNKMDHFTFKIVKHRTKDMYFAYVLSGGNDVYSYMGIFDTSSLKVVKGRKGIQSTSKSVMVLNWAIRVINGEKVLPNGYDIQHEGLCAKCGRALTDPRSIKSGFGPTCENNRKRR